MRKMTTPAAPPGFLHARSMRHSLRAEMLGFVTGGGAPGSTVRFTVIVAGLPCAPAEVT